MSLIDLLPKVPKVSDLVAALDQLDQRVIALEAYVVRNDNRITALENRQTADNHELADHQAGAERRQAEVDQIKAELERAQWYARTGRKR